MPQPSVDLQAAEEHIAELRRRSSRFSASFEDRALVRGWVRLQEALAEARLSGRREERRIAEAQLEHRRRCAGMIATEGADRLFALGDVVSLELLRGMLRPGGGGGGLGAVLGPARAGLEQSARRSGLLDGLGRLNEHPIVALSMIRLGWRADCGVVGGSLEPIALDGVDLYRIRYGLGLPLTQRLSSLERHARRYPAYPAERARAALFLQAGERPSALLTLQRLQLQRPSDISIRNNILYLQSSER